VLPLLKIYPLTDFTNNIASKTQKIVFPSKNTTIGSVFFFSIF